jgi:hypothetical protein
MRKKLLLYTIAAGSLLFVAFKVTGDIIAKLGMRSDHAQKYVLCNLLGNFQEESADDNGPFSKEPEQQYFQLPYLKLLPSIINGDKAGAAKELCAYIKMYCNSEEFMTAYMAKREKNKPTSEPARPNAATIKATRDSYEKMEAELAKSKKKPGATPEMFASFDASQKQRRDLLAQWQDSTPNKRKWEKLYPADPSVIVKKRLEEYLALVATVDFSAALIAGKDNKKVFADPKYEKKSLQWKAVYRAGKEVNDIVSAFVKEWLKGEIIASVKSKMPMAANSDPVQNNNTGSNSNSPASEKKGEVVKEKKSILKKIKNKVIN